MFVLFCVAPEGGAATIARGLYFEGRNQRIWYFSGTSWDEVKDAKLVAGLLERADRPPIFDRQRLRLLPPSDSDSDNQALHFEQRALSNQWQALPWERGRVAIDHWRELLFMDNQLWVATPVGLVPFQRVGLESRSQLYRAVWIDGDPVGLPLLWSPV